MAVTLRKRTSVIEVMADCPVGAAVGDMVYASADRIAGIYQVDLCDIDQANKRPIGILRQKTSPTRCYVQTSGPLEGIYTGLTVNRHLFLGTGVGARLVQIPPMHPSVGTRYFQIAGIALATDVFDLKLMQPVILHS